jgi:hypothetical protein
MATRLTILKPGTYYWSVQAIDGSYMSSAFADEGTFTDRCSTIFCNNTSGEPSVQKQYSDHMVELDMGISYMQMMQTFLIERSDIR